jgi:peptidoglycan/LPS O-acetylase OafA/YrhL
LLGFLIVPACVGWKVYTWLPYDEKFFPRLILFLVMMPNLAEAIWPGAVPIAHLWSIGVEEQFYLLWPALMKWFSRWTIWVILAVIGLKLLSIKWDISMQVATRNWHRGDWAGEWKVFFLFLRLLRLDCMAVGGLAAWVAFRVKDRPDLSRWIYNPVSTLAAAAAMIWSVVVMYRPYTLYGSVPHGGLYALFILCVGANPRIPRSIFLAPIDYVGRISYGIYMYHVVVMFCLLRYLQHHEIAWHTGFQYVKAKRGVRIVAPPVASMGRNLALLFVVLAITVAVATVSFYFFERPFLKLKRKYTIVKSGSPESASVTA